MRTSTMSRGRWPLLADLTHRGVLVVVFLGLTTTACAHRLASAYQRLGVSRVDDHLVVQYLSCAGEDVQSLRILLLDDDNVAGEEGDVVLWEVHDPVADVLVSGVVPDDADGDALTLRDGEEYYVEVITSWNSADSDSFTTTDLSTTHVLVNGKMLGSSEFVAHAAESC